MPICEVCKEDVELPLPGQGPAISGCWWNASAYVDRLAGQGVPGALHVEGWAVRRRDGKLEPFQHGWVELPDGTRLDDTPHHHVEEYLGGLKFTPAEALALSLSGVFVPYHRDLTRVPTEEEPNPHFDPARAESYSEFRKQAEEHCKEP